VDVEHPLGPEPAHRLRIERGAIATSGLATRIWRRGDGFAHHLIDPASGEPAWTGLIQATALAPTALEAETIAKSALLSGPVTGRADLSEHGGVLIHDDGTVEVVEAASNVAEEPIAA
jgi:thiamine biosynthesis lipoprotein